MKTPQYDENARSTVKTPNQPGATPNGIADSISDPWRQMIELIARQLVKAWAKQSNSMTDS